jgi:hypothetical protein
VAPAWHQDILELFEKAWNCFFCAMSRRHNLWGKVGFCSDLCIDFIAENNGAQGRNRTTDTRIFSGTGNLSTTPQYLSAYPEIRMSSAY